MKIRRIIAGLSATVLAASCFAIGASANKLTDIVYPSDTDSAMNDSYYKIGAMGYYMNQQWKWNQGDWIGIDDQGRLTIDYKISEVLTDTTLEGKGTLGDMGVMVCNLPDSYPFEVTVSEASFTDNDGNVTELWSVNEITSAEEDPEGNFRIHIRPEDQVNEDTGEVTIAKREEVAGWNEEGAFKGGTLHMVIDFGAPAASESGSGEEGGSDAGKTDSKDSSSTASGETKSSGSSTSGSTSGTAASTLTTTKSSGSASTGTAAKNNAAAGTAATASDATENAETGAAEDAALAIMALAATGVVVSKRRAH